jgi:hypothetical protein
MQANTPVIAKPRTLSSAHPPKKEKGRRGGEGRGGEGRGGEGKGESLLMKSWLEIAQ